MTMKKTITLFLPGLLLGASENMPVMPALSRLLSRSQCHSGANTIELALKSLFSGLGTSQIPAGALGALSHGLIQANDDTYWCRADPIECLVDHHSVYLLGNTHLQLTTDEEMACLSSLNQLLQQDGISIMTKHSEWYIRIPAQVDLVMNDLLEVLGKNMSPLLPSGPDQIYWRRLLTECQMLLQSSVVNEQRLAANKPLISSLWFWGLGALPKNIDTEFDFIYTNDSILQGLSICAKKPYANMPPKWESAMMVGANVLFSDMQFYSLFKQQLENAGHQLLAYYEENWFKPLLNALMQGHFDVLKLICADGRVFTIKKMNLKYFWKRICPVQKFSMV